MTSISFGCPLEVSHVHTTVRMVLVLQPPNTCKMSWDDTRVMTAADTLMAAIDKKLNPVYWTMRGHNRVQ